MFSPTVSLRTHYSSCLSSDDIEADHVAQVLVTDQVIIKFLIRITHQRFCKQGRMLGRSSFVKG